MKDKEIIRLKESIEKLKNEQRLEEEDTIKAPWDYVASPEEFGFCGAFRCDEDDEYDDEY